MEYMAVPIILLLAFAVVIGYGINCDHKVKMKELELIEKGIIKR